MTETISDLDNIGYQQLELSDSAPSTGGQFFVNCVAPTGGHEAGVTPGVGGEHGFTAGTSASNDVVYA